MSVDSSAPRSRRAVLAAALGGLGAVVVSRFVTPEAVKAADGDAVLVGSARTGATETSITVSGSANAIVGSSDTGTGLRGASTSTAIADLANPGSATGMIGTAGATGTPGDPGGTALNTSETGVYGFANTSSGSNGIWGDSFGGAGVFGTGDTGVYGSGYWGVYGTGTIAVMGDGTATETGVYGFAGNVSAPPPPAGVGVQATAGSTAQTALNVTGKAKFSRSGRTSVTAGHYSKKVTMAGVTTASYIIATLQTRRTGVYVHAVVPAAGYFTIYFNKTVSSTTYVGYLVIN
jgi:hypothetical protein